MSNLIWQLCPKCSGEGTIFSLNGSTVNTHKTCNLCNGQKVISVLTGRPPKDNAYETGTIINQ